MAQYRAWMLPKTGLGMWLVALMLLLAACAPAPIAAPATEQPPPEIPAFARADANTAAPELVQAERNAAAAGDLAQLAQLWSEDARIVEVRGQADAAADYVWKGREAILDRYRVAVFPNPPAPLDAAIDAQPTVAGARATLQNGVDHWQFVWDGERWWIQELVIGG